MWNWTLALISAAVIALPLFLGAAKAKVLIIAVGDSTTAGTPFFRSPLEAPPDGEGDPEGQFTYWMMRKHPQWNVLNQGIPGQTSMQIRLRLAEALKLNPRYVIIQSGASDILNGEPVKDIARQLLLMYQQAQGQSVMPVAATVLPYDKATPEQAKAITTLNDWIRTSSDRMRIPLADFNAATCNPTHPDLLKDSPDGLHPDIGGYRRMGLAAVEALEPIEKAWR